MFDTLHEECGIFGIYNSESAAKLTFLGLYSLQHRGQESAGILTTDGRRVCEYRGLGLVAQVFDEEAISKLTGSIAIGHNRYSTTGHPRFTNIQPLLVDCKIGKIALAHNGNLVNALEVRHEMERSGSIFGTTMDSEIILHLIARSKEAALEDMIIDAISHVRGAYSLLLMTQDKLIGMRDPNGFRPLLLGRLDESYILASESCALDIIGAEYIRDLKPGELVIIDEGGIHSITAFESSKQAKCIFEFIYFSRPDSIVFEENVDKIRRKLGVVLAKNHPADADIVIAVPDSSNTSALGFARESGMPFELGLIRNHYVGRTFIQPEQSIRDGNVRVKFNPVKGVLKGKRIVVVDDSIVRGSTMKKLVKMLRKVGVEEVHLRICSPPIKFPCFYGIDTPAQSELIASSQSVEKTKEYLGADSLEHLTIDDLRSVVDDPDDFCYACFTGEYPVPLLHDHKKAALEDKMVKS
ncbi:MAG: amidophosphoribosyltransferase [Candidatus Latescibacteria bacterium]|nr:amidophosphoribosyltransferase [Candidatus Latescibacterota bacterium]NIM22079.1 amidophosphoribosyltransferase [Candidatus Latescibacterota bacterium]NIM66098.1 amidophosphoribosyltransferase [Candidatus Latescibacterota bacterium]NIO02506.1 amidophosphoribosyltransferase [Candidatus Latescibacterota bacterium]NIO29417.1 amidophosphoribosyltransferase [Candidatus Latescibacterota bacterium]